jgi:hypothetical protein
MKSSLMFPLIPNEKISPSSFIISITGSGMDADNLYTFLQNIKRLSPFNNSSRVAILTP